MKETFFDKLKSWKRWMAFLAAILPIVGELLTGAQGWPDAIQQALAALLISMGVIAVDDASKRKAATLSAALEKKD